ncbi:YciI family protein [Maricaulis sp. CAU 1757]
MLFLVYARDRQCALPVRIANRDAHLAWLKEAGAMIKAAGPWMDDQGQMAGSLLIVEASERAAVETWLRTDPYNRAGLFERVEVSPYKWVVNPPDEVIL